jgi:hypothetical protein
MAHAPFISGCSRNAAAAVSVTEFNVVMFLKATKYAAAYLIQSTISS